MSTEHSATDTLREVLSELDPLAHYAKPNTLGTLQQKVCAVVDELKATGMSPEHIMLVVKGIASESRVDPSSPLVEQMVKWCIEQYFKESKAD